MSTLYPVAEAGWSVGCVTIKVPEPERFTVTSGDTFVSWEPRNRRCGQNMSPPGKVPEDKSALKTGATMGSGRRVNQSTAVERAGNEFLTVINRKRAGGDLESHQNPDSGLTDHRRRQ